MTPPSPDSSAASTPALAQRASRAVWFLSTLGNPVVRCVAYVGGMGWMLLDVVVWTWRSVVLRQVRFGRPALYGQIVRVGTRSIGVNVLVSGCIGIILALQMAPPLEDFGQTQSVANIIAVAMFRELGPLITAIVLTGFAGASIAAELGTMVVGEELEALRAHALNPIRFLVLPRVLAAVVATVVLCVVCELVAVAGGWAVGVGLLHIPSTIYIANTIDQLGLADFLTGIWKAGVFGALIGLIACYNGLGVTGGAAGVGKATTNTVVHSIVAIIFTDLIFTATFYRLGWT